MGFLDKLLGSGKKKEFGRVLADFLNEYRELTRIEYNEDAYHLVLEDVLGKRTVRLEKYYKSYAAAGESERESVLDSIAEKLIRTHRNVPRDYDTAKPGLYPYLRQRVYFQVRPLNLEVSGQPAPAMPHAAISDHLAVEMAYTTNDGAVVPLDNSHLEAWSVPFETSLNDGMLNLRNLADRRWSVPEARVYVSPWHGNFDASSLLFSDLIKDFRVIGRHVVMAPIHNMVVVTGSNDHHGLAKMADLAEDTIRNNAYFLSTIPLVLEDNEWKSFLLPREHRLHRRYKILMVESLMRDYTAQKEALEAWYAKAGQHVAVADFTAVDNGNTGQCTSYCVWPNHAPPLLLPESDQIYFMTDPESGVVDRMAEWKNVRAELGEFFAPMGMTPERYRVAGYPNAAQFSAFGGR